MTGNVEDTKKEARGVPLPTPTALTAARTAAVILGPALVADVAIVLSGLATVGGLLRSDVWQGRPLRLLAALVALAAAAYAFAVRPWSRTWGATRDDTSEMLPGDELIPRLAWESTRAIAIEAPAENVWPWLVQMGQGRGGLYSYDWLENLVGLNIQSADQIHPQLLQHLELGDSVRPRRARIRSESRSSSRNVRSFWL